MKKTKILVPAMAVLALGMAAAVTGTVAWYSSTNIVYANGINVQSKTAQSLQISDASTGPWSTSVNHTSAMKADLNPAYCLDTAGTLTGEGTVLPQFVSLDQAKVDNPGSGVGEDAWYVDTAGKVRTFDGNNLVAPALPASNNPWNNERALNPVLPNVQTASDWLKLDTTVSTASETVHANVSIGRTAPQLIDKALVFGFYNVQTKLWETTKPFATAQDSDLNLQISNLTNFTVTPTATEYQFYMWYDGEDAVTVNQNAIANPISVTITYSIVPQNNG